VTDSGSSSRAKDGQQDGAAQATGQKGNNDAAAADLDDCASSADLPVYNVVPVEMVT